MLLAEMASSKMRKATSNQRRRGGEPENIMDRNRTLVEDYVQNMQTLRVQKLLERTQKLDRAQFVKEMVLHARRNSAIEGSLKWEHFRERRTEAVDRYIAIRNRQGRARMLLIATTSHHILAKIAKAYASHKAAVIV